MAVIRDRPYVQFNFLVDLGDGNTDGPDAGFAEVSGLEMTVDVIEYRTGNSKENELMKLPGQSRVANVTLRRGLIGSLKLYQWIDQIRNGGNGLRNVTIQLQNEDHSATVLTWKLLRARVASYRTGPLQAKGTDVAMEELVLAFERLEME